MAKLIFATVTSLDGYIADDGNLDWWVPDADTMRLINEVERPIGTHLIGRKNYETMAIWETPELIPGLTPVMMEFARTWQGAEKVVFSRTLESVSAPKTRLEREFEPEAIRDLKGRSTNDLSISGPTLAEIAIRSGLVDEYHLFVMPMLLGGGKRIMPRDVRIRLDLLDERRTADGTLYLRYGVHG